MNKLEDLSDERLEEILKELGVKEKLIPHLGDKKAVIKEKAENSTHLKELINPDWSPPTQSERFMKKMCTILEGSASMLGLRYSSKEDIIKEANQKAPKDWLEAIENKDVEKMRKDSRFDYITKGQAANQLLHHSDYLYSGKQTERVKNLRAKIINALTFCVLVLAAVQGEWGLHAFNRIWYVKENEDLNIIELTWEDDNNGE